MQEGDASVTISVNITSEKFVLVCLYPATEYIEKVMGIHGHYEDVESPEEYISLMKKICKASPECRPFLSGCIIKTPPGKCEFISVPVGDYYVLARYKKGFKQPGFSSADRDWISANSLISSDRIAEMVERRPTEIKGRHGSRTFTSADLVYIDVSDTVGLAKKIHVAPGRHVDVELDEKAPHASFHPPRLSSLVQIDDICLHLYLYHELMIIH
jgi:hypothetical protein